MCENKQSQQFNKNMIKALYVTVYTNDKIRKWIAETFFVTILNLTYTYAAAD